MSAMTTDTLTGLLTLSGYRVVLENTGGNCTALRIEHPAISGYVLATEAYGQLAPWSHCGEEFDGGVQIVHYEHSDSYDEATIFGLTESDVMVPTVLLHALASVRSDVLL